MLPNPTRYADVIARTAGPAEFSDPHDTKMGLIVNAPVVDKNMAKYFTPVMLMVANNAKPIGIKGAMNMRTFPRFRIRSEMIAAEAQTIVATKYGGTVSNCEMIEVKPMVLSTVGYYIVSVVSI